MLLRNHRLCLASSLLIWKPQIPLMLAERLPWGLICSPPNTRAFRIGAGAAIRRNCNSRKRTHAKPALTKGLGEATSWAIVRCWQGLRGQIASVDTTEHGQCPTHG